MSFNPIELWGKMTIVAQGVVVVLIIMSIYSLTIAFERFLYYRKARNQSVAYAKMVTSFLKQDKLAGRHRRLEEVQEQPRRASSLGRAATSSRTTSRAAGPTCKGHDMIEAAERAIEREALVTTADLKKGLSGLATIGTTAPFIGLFGTVIGIINAFRGMALTGSGGIAAVSAGISEALVTTALGLFVAIPAVWMFNIFMNNIERFQVEMSNSSNELIDYFIKRRGAGAQLSA